MRWNGTRYVVVIAVLAAAGGSLHAPATAGGKAAVKFEGKWKYQSFRPEPASLAAEDKHPKFETWSPPGVLTIDTGGTTGKLEFPAVKLTLDVTIQVADGDPATLLVSAKGQAPVAGFTNKLQGWFVPATLGQDVSDANPLVVRGSIVQTSTGLKKDGGYHKYTTGFFVLEPMK